MVILYDRVLNNSGSRLHSRADRLLGAAAKTPNHLVNTSEGLRTFSLSTVLPEDDRVAHMQEFLCLLSIPRHPRNVMFRTRI